MVAKGISNKVQASKAEDLGWGNGQVSRRAGALLWGCTLEAPEVDTVSRYRLIGVDGEEIHPKLDGIGNRATDLT